MLDLEGYLASHGGVRSAGSNGLQYLLECPWCGSRDLYVAIEPRPRSYKARPTRPGDFICFKGKCGRSGGLTALFAELEGLSYKEAKVQLVLERSGRWVRPPVCGTRASRVLPPPPRASSDLAARVAPSARRGEQLASPRDPEDSLLPGEFVACWDGHRWRVPRYLTGRGLSRETIRAFGLGFCDEGAYQGRIVIPITCPAGRSFTTRAVDPQDRRRYLSGPNAGMLLFGWPQAEGADEMVIVEGPFDAMAVSQIGLKAIAIMGKTFRESQLTMLRTCGARRLVLMLDGDALDDALRQAPMLGSAVVVAGPLGAKDPAKAVEDGVPHLISDAAARSVSVEAAKRSRVLERLRQRRSRWDLKLGNNPS